jgi:predicted molibdopterin-dependent oxidoreductase YjgC
LQNLALITGKLGKTGSGLIALKEKNNSQGLHDMGICRKHGVGSVRVANPGNLTLKESLQGGMFKNIFIFGEDPVGCAAEKAQVEGWLRNAGFLVVQDYFMTETAAMADLILPASFPVESGGSYTNTLKMIQGFEAHFKPVVEKTNLEQLAGLLNANGIAQSADHHEVLAEVISKLPKGEEEKKFSFSIAGGDNPARLFDHGCDYLVKRFDEDFERAFENAKIELYERV